MPGGPGARMLHPAMDEDHEDHEEFEDFDDEDFDEEPEPLSADEVASVRRDLEDLAVFRRIFAPQGFKGVSMYCTDCMEEHFHGWDMLENSLRALLDSGEYPVHEPAFSPRPDEYVDWEYARGYADGLSDASGPPARQLATIGAACPYCDGPLPQDGVAASYCPSCGASLAPARITKALLSRGWSAEQVEELLRTARVSPVADRTRS